MIEIRWISAISLFKTVAKSETHFKIHSNLYHQSNIYFLGSNIEHTTVLIVILSNLITRIRHLAAPHKILLDTPHTHKPAQQVRTSRLIIRPAGSRPTERLLAHHRPCGLAIHIEVARRVPQRPLGKRGRFTVLRENGPRERVVGCAVDELALLGEGVGLGVVVDINGEDGAEELGGEEWVGRVGGAVDGRVDVVALAIVVGAAHQQLELRIGSGGVDDGAEFVEGGAVDDGADEIFEVGGRADLEVLGLFDETGVDGRPEGGRYVGPGGGAAFLTLVFEGAADGVDNGIMRVSARMDEMEVLAAGFAYDARVASVRAIGDVFGDGAVEAAKDGGAAGVVQTGEVAVGERDGSDLLGISGDELDDIGGEAGFEKDLVDDGVGSDG